MGIFLILFPDERHQQIQSTNDNNPISKKKPVNFQSISSILCAPTIAQRHQFSQFAVQSPVCNLHLQFCTLLLFIVLLLFTISTLPSTTATTATRDYHRLRRQLNRIPSSGQNSSPHALQGMGTFYRRGTRAMNDLVVAHAVESLTPHQFKLFLRLLHRSGTTSKLDLLFVFPSKTAVFDRLIREENDYFMKLVDQYETSSMNSNNYSYSFPSFKPTHFVKKMDKSKRTGEPILGRVRRNFNHITLVDMKEVLLIDDPFDKIRGSDMESVLVFTQPSDNKHGRRNPDKAQKLATPTIAIGGDRGIRRLSKLMLTEIVRTSTQKRKRNLASEAAIFNQVVGNPSR